MKKATSLFTALFCLVWLTGATWLPLFQQASGVTTPVLDGTPQSGLNFFGTSQATGTLTTAVGSGQVFVAVYASGTVEPALRAEVKDHFHELPGFAPIIYAADKLSN